MESSNTYDTHDVWLVIPMSKALNWTKKPITIQALHYEKPNDFDEIEKFVGKENMFCTYLKYVGGEVVEAKFSIRTLEGYMIVSVGDYIIKGVNGELYPCKPDIFEKTYVFHSNVQEVDDATR